MGRCFKLLNWKMAAHVRKPFPNPKWDKLVGRVYMEEWMLGFELQQTLQAAWCPYCLLHRWAEKVAGCWVISMRSFWNCLGNRELFSAPFAMEHNNTPPCPPKPTKPLNPLILVLCGTIYKLEIFPRYKPTSLKACISQWKVSKAYKA